MCIQISQLQFGKIYVLLQLYHNYKIIWIVQRSDFITTHIFLSAILWMYVAATAE